MSGDHGLIQQAAAGSAAAQLSLVDDAIATGAAGVVRHVEALIAAETWARLAAARGGFEENRVLAGVLLARCDFERREGRNAGWYEAEAERALARAAGGILANTKPGGDNSPAARFDRALTSAAAGERDPLRQLFDFAAESLIVGRSDPLEALVIGELYGRLGEAAGDPEMIRRLGTILTARSSFEDEHGDQCLAKSTLAEAAIIFAECADRGDTLAAEYLAEMSRFPIPAAVADAVRMTPRILMHMPIEGHC